MVSVEFFNFVHAFPALEGCARKTEEEIAGYLEMILRGEAPNREEQEAIFPDMARRMQEKIGDNYWTIKGAKQYWWVEHNKIIDNREAGYEGASDEHCEDCKVGFWKVWRLMNNGEFAILRNKNGGTTTVVNYRNLELDNTKYVTIHKHNVAEIVTPKDFEKYG